MSAVVASVLSALVVAGLCLLGPAVIRRLPEPVEDDADEPTAADDSDSTDSTDNDVGDRADRTAADLTLIDGGPAESPMSGTAVVKVPYRELADRPHLALKLAATGLVVGAVIGAALSDQPILMAWLYLGALGVCLGYVDAQTRLLPTRMIAPSYAVVVVLIGLAALVDGETDDLVRAGLGWAVYGGFYFVMWFVYPRGLGYGDVRLSGLLGLGLGYVGWGELLVGMYAGFLIGGLVGGLLAVLRIVDRKRYPFGPFMLVGAVVGLVVGAPFTDWYTGA